MFRWLRNRRMARDNAKAVAAYQVQFSFYEATLLLLQGDRRRYVEWYGSRQAIYMAQDRVLAQLWLRGLRVEPTDCRTRRLSVEAAA